jgi:hypothetical protein
MSNTKKIEPSDGTIPLPVINQLNEHTAGGFILFYFNSKDGTPEEFITFDSPAHCLALEQHVGNWSTAIKEINIDMEKHHIISSCQSEKKQDGEGQEV